MSTTLALPNTPLSPTFFQRIPPEIIRLIGEQTVSTYDCWSLCLASKLCNAACTSVLYGKDISLRYAVVLRSLVQTLLLLRPELRASVRVLDIYVLGVDDPRHKEGLREWSTVDQLCNLIDACTNIQSLSLACSRVSDSGVLRDVFSRRPYIPANGHLSPHSFSSLRDLNLTFGLDLHAFDFVSRHCWKLRSLTLHHKHDHGTDGGVSFGREICALYHSPSIDKSQTGSLNPEEENSPERSLRLPSTCTYLSVSPYFLPALLPSSYVSDVSLEWYTATEYLNDQANNIVKELARARSPGIKTLTYKSLSWNTKFLETLADGVESVELVMIENQLNEDWATFSPSPFDISILFADSDFSLAIALLLIMCPHLVQHLQAEMMDSLPRILPRFENLKALIFNAPYSTNSPGRPLLDDFLNMRSWSLLCPTLIYVALPFSPTRWIRICDLQYRFFIPDDNLETLHGDHFQDFLTASFWDDDQNTDDVEAMTVAKVTEMARRVRDMRQACGDVPVDNVEDWVYWKGGAVDEAGEENVVRRVKSLLDRARVRL